MLTQLKLSLPLTSNFMIKMIIYHLLEHSKNQVNQVHIITQTLLIAKLKAKEKVY